MKESSKDRSKITAGIVGLGYVGIPLALQVSRAGLQVIGFDILPARVAGLNAGKSPIGHVADKELAELVASGFVATQDYSRIGECDAVIICVPTPLNKMREPDLSFIVSTMQQLTPYLRAGQILSLESTTWPGTTEEVLLPFIESKGLKVGSDFHLVFSPEREDPGNAEFSLTTTPKIVGGHTPACLAAGSAFYGRFIDQIVPVSSTRAAEMTKLLENIYRAVNIGLVNELKVVADKMGLDIFEIIDAAKTKPFGYTAFYPGPGIGGHCIPVDPFYLTWKAREFGLHTRLIELAGEINAGMPDYVVGKLMKGLNASGKAVRGAQILVLGITYKRDVDDMRESPAVVVMERLRDLGAILSYADPYVPHFPEMRDHSFELQATPVTAEVLSQNDAVLLLTDHSCFDYELIRTSSKLLIDTRGKFTDNGTTILRG